MFTSITLRAGPVAVRSLHRSVPLARSVASAMPRSSFSTSTVSVCVRARPAATTSPSTIARIVSKRTYMQQTPTPVVEHQQAGVGRKLLTTGLLFGSTLVGLNFMFNRDTRDDGGMPIFEREYLNDTFMHTGLGLGVIAFTARSMVRSGFVFRIMMMNPWAVGIGGLALSIGTMIGTQAIDPDNYVPKYALWTAFNVTQAAILAPMMAFFPPAILARAGLYTVAMMGSLSFIGATARQDKYLYIGGPLLAGMGVVLASGLAPAILPVTAIRTLAFSENIWLYGGLVVMGGFTLYDVQKILHHARMSERGLKKRDPVNESIGLELDFINIFIRMAQILMMQNGNKRK